MEKRLSPSIRWTTEWTTTFELDHGVGHYIQVGPRSGPLHSSWTTEWTTTFKLDHGVVHYIMGSLHLTRSLARESVLEAVDSTRDEPLATRSDWRS
jgi:hypothetical protein